MLNPRFFSGRSKRPRCKAAGRRPSEAYWRYAAESAEAGGVPVRRMGHRRWAFFSSLLMLAPSAGF